MDEFRSSSKKSKESALKVNENAEELKVPAVYSPEIINERANPRIELNDEGVDIRISSAVPVQNDQSDDIRISSAVPVQNDSIQNDDIRISSAVENIDEIRLSSPESP